MTYVIAEIGNNHEGKPEAAIELVKLAIRADVDAVKMQAFTAHELVSADLPAMVGTHKTQIERMESLELPLEVYQECSAVCESRNVDFIASPFSTYWAEVLEPLVNYFKIASGELTHVDLLRSIRLTLKPVIISTGMANLQEIHGTVEMFPLKHITLLHCVSIYPCPYELAGLNRIKILKKAFPDLKSYGYSDHCIGPNACLAAVAVGAQVIEKHFTALSECETGDHIHSLDFSGMINLIKNVNEIEKAMPYKGLSDIFMRKQLRRGSSGLRGA